MELVSTQSIVLGEQDTLEPLLNSGGNFHHEVVAVQEEAYVFVNMHEQVWIVETLDELVVVQDLRVVSLPTRSRIHHAVHAPSQQATVLGVFPVRLCKSFLLLFRKFKAQLSHGHTMEVPAADFVHRQSTLV